MSDVPPTPEPPLPLPGWAARNERRKFVASLFWGLAAAVAGFGVVRPAFDQGVQAMGVSNTVAAVVIFAVLCAVSYILLGRIEDK